MATVKEEKDEQAFFARKVEEQKQQERKEHTMADTKPTPTHQSPLVAGKRVDEKKAEPANTQTQAEIDPVHIAVTNCPDFRDSIIMLLDGVAADIVANKDDPNAVAKVASKLKERSGTYADAAVANTHYAPVPTVETEKGRTEREAKKL